METNTEKVFYQDHNVTVTQARFVSDSKTYAMRNISSVSIRKIDRSIKGEIILIILGVILLATQVWFVGIAVVVIAVILLFTRKDSFSVRINSNSGEADGLISKDRDMIEKVVHALNEAIVHRG